MLLIIAGQPRSGSTVSYQVTKKLLEYNGVGGSYAPYWRDDQYFFNRLNECAKDEKYHLIKTHAYRGNLDKINKNRIKVLMSVRDLRMVAQSLKNFFGSSYKKMCENFPYVHLNQYNGWYKKLPHTHILEYKYEDYIEGKNLIQLPKLICDFLGISCDNELSQRIYNECNREVNLKRIEKLNDKDEFGFSNNHINQQPEIVPQFVIDHIYSVAGDWMIEHGYER